MALARWKDLCPDAVDPPGQAEVLGARLTDGPDDVPRWLADVPGLPWDVWKLVPVPDIAALLSAGATVVGQRDDEIGWDVLADPAGNEFCAILPADSSS